jgi:hypothetical protein
MINHHIDIGTKAYCSPIAKKGKKKIIQVQTRVKCTLQITTTSRNLPVYNGPRGSHYNLLQNRIRKLLTKIEKLRLQNASLAVKRA